MTLTFRHGLLAALLAGAPVILTTVSMPAAAQALSPAVGNPLKRAQQLHSGAAAIAAVNPARAAAKTPAERAKVSQMAAYRLLELGPVSRRPRTNSRRSARRRASSRPIITARASMTARSNSPSARAGKTCRS